ncbi:DUF7604 domain-containing protein [Oribacterium asaccharolyticum]|uniref:DUF7604 domain-containing protein n=1 Tax=Oribacterium asaccharolyticum TaxID=1501332 RepID=UPI0028EE99E6|nr:hypothetical protein [Oribacterium asaccharolyticum]
MMKTNQNNHIMNMNKGMKQKLSMLLIACLLFTGYRGLTIPGRAEQGNTEQNNAISVSGTQVKVQLLGEDLRRAAKEAIEKGERVDDSVLKGYSKDEELQKSYAGIFSLDKEVYEIPLDSISEGLSESLAEEEAGLQVFVERDAQDLDNLVRKESKESLLLYDGKSQLEQLFPKGEETESVKKEEEENLASDSNLVRNTELTGSELITFLYKNKADHRITFQLSVDGNKYPKVTVSPKTQLFKELVDKLKKEEKKVPVETTKAPESKIEESTEAKNTASEAQLAESTTSSEEVKETAKQAASKEETTEASVTEASTEDSASKVSIVSEEKKEETSEQETSEAAVKAEEKNEESAETETAAEAPVKKESTKEVEVKFSGFLQDVISHYEEFLGELVSARFSQYSLNELGRKSQNVEIEGFATVEVFYEEAAFDKEVVLEAKRLFKPEEETEGEKLSEEQVKVLKEHSIYDDAASLDIRFVDKKDSATEVEPKSPVSVRITIDKKALPETVSPDTISIHHLVENDETKEIEKVDTVVQANASKKLIVNDDATYNSEDEKELENSKSTLKTNNGDSDEEVKKETITKEFTVDSFSLYQITWTDDELANCPPIRFHYVDKNFNEIWPTKRVEIKKRSGIYGSQLYVGQTFFNRSPNPDSTPSGDALKSFYGYKFVEVYPFKLPYDNLQYINNGNSTDYFDIQYKYDSSNPPKEFGEGVKYINDTGFMTWKSYRNGEHDTRWYWYNSAGQIQYCGTYDFYFVYDIDPVTVTKIDDKEVEPRNEKFIKDNLDGTYDLTLTGQVKNQTKEELDIIFLLDTTKSMNLPFETIEGLGDYTEDDFASKKSLVSRKDKTIEYINAMVDDISGDKNYDAQFALVGFGGDRKETVAQGGYFYWGGPTRDRRILADEKKSKVKPESITITDTPFNDTTRVYEFTSSAEQFKRNLKNLPETESVNTGANYVAAIIGMNYLLTGDEYQKLQGKIVGANKARPNAKKIVVMLADGDPMYSYALEDGQYDDTTVNTGFNKNYSSVFETVTNLKRGYSYGNGKTFNRVGLNQARGLLAKIDRYSAFYSIGIGNTKNWPHLKELTEAHAFDQDSKWASFGSKFIRAGSALAKNVDHKVYDGSTPELLKSTFIELKNTIAPKATNLTINDTLSENVTFVKDTELKVEVFKMKSNGVEPDGNALTEAQLKDMGLKKFILEKPLASLEQGGKIKLSTDPADFALPGGYEIRLTATIKPSVKAYEKLRNGQASKDEGDERTDLQDIFRREEISLPSEFSNSAMYGTSAKKFGLYTNDEAKFGYKWKGQDKSKDYKRPIIKVNRADLKIEKTFVGLDKKLVNNSSGVTKFGKEIVQQLKFDILRSENKPGTNPAKSFLTINFEEAPWADALNDPEVSRNGKKVPVTIDGENHEVTILLINEANGKPKLSITVNNLDSEKYDYHVWEYINGLENNKAKAVLDPDEPGTQYRYIGGGGPNGPKSIDNTACGIFKFQNSYQKEQPKKTVTIKKIVQEFGGTAYSQEALNKKFDFYIALYKYNGSEYEALNYREIETIINKWIAENPGKGDIVTGKYKDEIPVPIGDNKTVKTYLPKISLKHGESISLDLDANLYYKILESKDEGYEVAKAVVNNSGHESPITIKEVHINECDYSITEIMDQGKEFTFKNPRITLVPTGLRGDITPYLFSIFGFTMMAGMYLTIRKKKRVEI